jgi:hypothetical protein
VPVFRNNRAKGRTVEKLALQIRSRGIINAEIFGYVGHSAIFILLFEISFRMAEVLRINRTREVGSGK